MTSSLVICVYDSACYMLGGVRLTIHTLYYYSVCICVPLLLLISLLSYLIFIIFILYHAYNYSVVS